MYKEIILSKTVDYLKLKKIEYRGFKVITMKCVFCNAPGCSANIIPNTSKIHCLACKHDYNLITLVKKYENKESESDENILEYLKNILKVDVITAKEEINIEKLLNQYYARSWALVPCAKKEKNVIQSDWTNKENRNIGEWFHWINSGLNIGVRTGEVSKMSVLDFDMLTKEEKVELVKESTPQARKDELEKKKIIPEEIKKLLNPTLIQATLGGWHYCYAYEASLPKTAFAYEHFNIDIENDGGQIIIAPSMVNVDEKITDATGKVTRNIVGCRSRSFINEESINPMSKELIEFLLANIKKVKDRTPAPEREHNPNIDEPAPANGDYASNHVPLVNNDLQGVCNSTFVKIGGIFRKELNIKQTAFALHVINRQLLRNPMEPQAIDAMVDQLDKYIEGDEKELANDILAYLKMTDTANKMEIESAVFGGRTTSENKKRLDKTLLYLLREEKISKRNSRDYKFIQEMDWTDNILDVGVPINFKMPFFHDYAYFNWGDLILIGGTTKAGKSTLAINIVKRLIDQGIKPRYIYNESGGRYAKTALTLGLKDKDFFKTKCSNPDELILKPNSVYVYDWIRPRDFAKTDETFERLIDKIDKANSIMIGFVQLRDENEKGVSNWFAKDLIRQFCALSAKYLHESNDGINTCLELADIRDRKAGGAIHKIPTVYHPATRLIKTVEEIEQEKEDQKR